MSRLVAVLAMILLLGSLAVRVPGPRSLLALLMPLLASCAGPGKTIRVNEGGLCCCIELGRVRANAGRFGKLGAKEITQMWKRLMMLAVLALPVMCWADEHAETCQRKFDEAQLRRILHDVVHTDDYMLTVHWSHCKYFMLVWSRPVTPDSQKIVTLDADGNVIDGPR